MNATPEEFIENFLSHAVTPEQVKEYNRQYYLRNRKLKGRQAGSAAPVNPRSNRTPDGRPVPRGNKRMLEDESPDVSPTGAKLVDFGSAKSGPGKNGMATYADGSVYTPETGWTQGGAGAAKAATAKNNAEKVLNGVPIPVKMNPKRRIGAAEQKVIRAKTLASQIKDPKVKSQILKKIADSERKLKVIKKRVNPNQRALNSGLTETSKRGSSTRPVLRRQPPSGV